MGRKKRTRISKALRMKDKKRQTKIALNKHSNQMFDKKNKNVQQQYFLLGIEGDPNKTLVKHQVKRKMIKKSIRDREGTKTRGEPRKHFLEYLPERKIVLTKKMIRKQLKKDVFRRLMALQKKHGNDNYIGMSFDPINFLQDTESKLKKKIKWMNKWEYNRKLLAWYMNGDDFTRTQKDAVYNWQKKNLDDLKQELNDFIDHEITEEHKKILVDEGKIQIKEIVKEVTMKVKT